MLKNIIITSFCLVAISMPISTAIADNDVDNSKNEKKRVVAAKLNSYWAVRDQASMMIDLMSKEIPQTQKPAFRSYMTKVLDLNEIDKISIDAAVEVFTQEELEAMLEYYSQDVVRSAEKKRAKYNSIIGPKIKMMIDRGMINAAGELQRLKSLQ